VVDLKVESREFEAYIRELTDGMQPEVLRKTLVKTAFDFIGGVVKLTPKDTGRAAAAWTVWADAAGKPVPVRDSKGTGIAQGKTEGEFSEDTRGADQYIELTNGVPYIVPLEYGHSKKGTGAVRISMRRIREKIDKNAQKALEDEIRKADAKSRPLRGT